MDSAVNGDDQVPYGATLAVVDGMRLRMQRVLTFLVQVVGGRMISGGPRIAGTLICVAPDSISCIIGSITWVERDVVYREYVRQRYGTWAKPRSGGKSGVSRERLGYGARTGCAGLGSRKASTLHRRI